MKNNKYNWKILRKYQIKFGNIICIGKNLLTNEHCDRLNDNKIDEWFQPQAAFQQLNIVTK